MVAFEELVARHRDKIYARAFSMMRNEEEALDLHLVEQDFRHAHAGLADTKNNDMATSPRIARVSHYAGF